MEQQATGLTLFNRQITSERTQNYLTSVLGAKKDSFVSNLTALVANNKALQECEPMGVMFAAIKATALDLPLDPNLGFAYVIPYKNNREGRTDAQFQIGAKGFIQLAIRSGQFKTLNVSEVKEGEIVDENLITGEITFKKAENRDALRTIGYVGYFKLTKGKRIFKMAPIHHHFELCGWSETRVVAVFSIITAILCLIALMAM